MHMLGYGLYNGLSTGKNGDQKLRVRQLFSEAKTLTASAQDGTDYEIPNLGDVVGIRVSITTICTGTLTTPTKLAAVVKEIAMRDANSKPIATNMAGTDLNFLTYITSAEGKKITETDNSTSSATDSYELQWSMDSSKLPARIRVSYNAYSACAASGTTGCTASVEIAVLYRDGATDVTYRLQKQTQALISGANDISSKLPRDVMINKLALNCTEGSLTDVIFTSDGSEELKMKTADLIKFMESNRSDARISNYLQVPCSPFVSTSKTNLVVDTSGSVASSDLFIVTMD